jgi:hypothetical protein
MSADKKYRPYFTAEELNYLYALIKEAPEENKPACLEANLKTWVLKVQENLVAPALTLKEKVHPELNLSSSSYGAKRGDSITAALKSGTLSEEDEDALFASQMAQLTL